MGSRGPRQECDNLPRLRDPLIIAAPAQRRRSREHEQQLIVCVMKWSGETITLGSNS